MRKSLNKVQRFVGCGMVERLNKSFEEKRCLSANVPHVFQWNTHKCQENHSWQKNRIESIQLHRVSQVHILKRFAGLVVFCSWFYHQLCTGSGPGTCHCTRLQHGDISAKIWCVLPCDSTACWSCPPSRCTCAAWVCCIMSSVNFRF
jgi:hypothetical protein